MKKTFTSGVGRMASWQLLFHAMWITVPARWLLLLSPVLLAAPFFRCTVNRRHTKSSRSHSFFDKGNLVFQDIILFIKSYLEKNSLAQCARFIGMAYRSTAVNWASFMREVFKEYFNNTLRNVKLQGIVEIDESLFGRRVKYHKGNPNRGLKAS